jgi:hypothetical protein
MEVLLTLLDLLVGGISLAIAIRLLSYFRRIKERATLALALFIASWSIACFLWAIEDCILIGNLKVATSAYIMEQLPAYFGVLFVVYIFKSRPKLLISISSIIIGVCIFSFIFFPLEKIAVEGGFYYYFSPVTRLALIPVIAMAFLPVALFFAYGLKMGKLEKFKERNKGIALATGFLLVAFANWILYPCFRTPVVVGWIMNLIGFFTLYFGFTRR